jgi:osmotically-inducible protein OsmY
MSNEKIIIEEIRSARARDPRIPHPAEVAVPEQGGTVTLRGSVSSSHQRRAASQIAKSVRGVERRSAAASR